MLFLLVAVLSPFLVFLMLWAANYARELRYLSSIPAPRPWPIIGITNEIPALTEFTAYLDALYEKYKTKTIRLNLGFRTALVIKDYSLVEFVLSSNKITDKGQGYNFLHPWLGTGLLTAAGEKWRKFRRILTPSFHFQVLENFIDVFNNCQMILIEKLRNEVGNPSVDIFPLMSRYTLDVICESAMGTSVNAQEVINSDYVQAVKDMCRIIQLRALNPILNFDFFYQFTKTYQTQVKALQILHGYTTSVIKRRRQEVSKISGNSLVDETGKKKRVAFLDLLLQSTIDGRPLTDDEIREEVDTFMFAGHDTTGTALSYTMFNLAQNPVAQQKAYEDVKSVLGNNKNCSISHEDINNMKYLELVIKESMRVLSPIPFFGRRTVEDITYKNITIPKNTTLQIYVQGIHKDPDNYTNPEKFDPDRFSSNEISKKPYKYIPFSAGPRNCIGQKFAMLEVKSTLARVLLNFELKPSSPPHKLLLSTETVLKSLNGVKIRLEERK